MNANKWQVTILGTCNQRIKRRSRQLVGWSGEQLSLVYTRHWGGFWVANIHMHAVSTVNGGRWLLSGDFNARHRRDDAPTHPLYLFFNGSLCGSSTTQHSCCQWTPRYICEIGGRFSDVTLRGCGGLREFNVGRWHRVGVEPFGFNWYGRL